MVFCCFLAVPSPAQESRQLRRQQFRRRQRGDVGRSLARLAAQRFNFRTWQAEAT